MRAWEVQTGVVARLTADAAVAAKVTAIYDHVPQEAAFPYLVVGEDVATSVDPDDRLASDHLVDVHTWSRYRGTKEAKQIQQLVYAALHRQPITVAGAVLVDFFCESQQTFLDADGLTRHGVQRFRALLDEVTP